MFKVNDCHLDYSEIRKIIRKKRVKVEAELKQNADERLKREWVALNHCIELLDKEQINAIRSDLR